MSDDRRTSYRYLSVVEIRDELNKLIEQGKGDEVVNVWASSQGYFVGEVQTKYGTIDFAPCTEDQQVLRPGK